MVAFHITLAWVATIVTLADAKSVNVNVVEVCEDDAGDETQLVQKPGRSTLRTFQSEEDDPVPKGTDVFSASFSLELLLAHREAKRHCWMGVDDWLPGATSEQGLGYLAVARTGSESLQIAIQQNLPSVRVPHNHDCTLRDLESINVSNVVISLRDPLARISSGVSRRLDLKHFDKQANEKFVTNFNGSNAVNEYVTALRQPSHPMHSVAMEVTVGPKRQSYMLPITEFYLARALGVARVTFVCTDTLTDDFNTLARNLGLPQNMNTHTHKSSGSSSDQIFVQARFSEENARWIRRLYAEDVRLVEEHCGNRLSAVDTGSKREEEEGLKTQGDRGKGVAVKVVPPDEERIEFIHIPKAAGGTIQEVASQHGHLWGARRPWPALDEAVMPCARWGGVSNHSWDHVPLCFWERHGINPFPNNRTSFCVVRHPYTRSISAFNYRHQNLPISQYCNAHTLNSFVQERLRVQSRSGDAIQKCELTKEVGVDDCHWLPQVMFTQHCMHRLRFEAISSEFSQLMQNFSQKGYLSNPFALENGDHAHISECRLSVDNLDATSRKLLNRVYTQDFEQLGYDVPPCVCNAAFPYCQSDDARCYESSISTSASTSQCVGTCTSSYERKQFHMADTKLHGNQALCPYFEYTGTEKGGACFSILAGNTELSPGSSCPCEQECGTDTWDHPNSVTFQNTKNVTGCSEGRATALLTVPKSWFRDIVALASVCPNATELLLADLLHGSFSSYQRHVGQGPVMQCVHHPEHTTVDYVHLHTFCAEGAMTDGGKMGLSGVGGSVVASPNFFCSTMKVAGEARGIAEAMAKYARYGPA
jgi:hypothetical protein